MTILHGFLKIDIPSEESRILNFVNNFIDIDLEGGYLEGNSLLKGFDLANKGNLNTNELISECIIDWINGKENNSQFVRYNRSECNTYY